MALPAVYAIQFHFEKTSNKRLISYGKEKKKRAELVPQTSSIYGKDAYATAFHRFVVAHQSKGFSNCCPQPWVTGLLQTQETRDNLLLRNT